MSDTYDRLVAAKQDLRLLASDLDSVLGQLEELGTAWRRDSIRSGDRLRQHPGFPLSLRDATKGLACTVRALVEAGVDQPPGLAFSAVAQLSALTEDVAAAAALGSDEFPGRPPAAGTPGAWASLQLTLSRIGRRLWSLISHLLKITEWSLTGQAAGGAFGPGNASIAVRFA